MAGRSRLRLLLRFEPIATGLNSDVEAFWPPQVGVRIPLDVVDGTRRLHRGPLIHCLGLRGILAHQAMDRAADIAAGARTFATQRSRESIRKIIVRLILPVEGAGVAVFVASLPSYPPALTLVLSVFAAGEAYRATRGLHMPLVFPEQPGRERYIPLSSNELYEVWLPCGLVWQLGFGGQGYYALPFAHLLLFREPIRRTAAMLGRFVAGATRRTA